jgi:hypothetical protein
MTREAACLVAALAACAGQAEMSGFSPAEARAQVAAQTVDACATRGGALVLEVEHALIREYPRHFPEQLGRRQPILLLTLQSRGDDPRTWELLPLIAPDAYRAGDRVDFFVGRRLLERPLRALAGRQIALRLADNGRTVAPLWTKYADALLHGSSSAASAAGLPSAPPAAIDIAIDLIARLDRDALILSWAQDLDALAHDLVAAPGKLLRLHLATSRTVASGPGAGLPAAELDLLIYREHEAGCP